MFGICVIWLLSEGCLIGGHCFFITTKICQGIASIVMTLRCVHYGKGFFCFLIFSCPIMGYALPTGILKQGCRFFRSVTLQRLSALLIRTNPEIFPGKGLAYLRNKHEGQKHS